MYSQLSCFFISHQSSIASAALSSVTWTYVCLSVCMDGCINGWTYVCIYIATSMYLCINVLLIHGPLRAPPPFLSFLQRPWRRFWKRGLERVPWWLLAHSWPALVTSCAHSPLLSFRFTSVSDSWQVWALLVNIGRWDWCLLEEALAY